MGLAFFFPATGLLVSTRYPVWFIQGCRAVNMFQSRAPIDLLHFLNLSMRNKITHKTCEK